MPRASAIPQSGGAFLTIESACHNPALLTLHFASIEWLGSSSSRPYGIHAAGHRKLLHRVLTQALAPGEAGNASVAFLPSNVPRPSAVPRPGHTAAQNTSSSDKYTPAQQPVAALNSTTAPLNRTAAPLNPGAGAALSNATNNSTERLACCCRYVSGALPYDPQQVRRGRQTVLAFLLLPGRLCVGTLLFVATRSVASIRCSGMSTA